MQGEVPAGQQQAGLTVARERSDEAVQAQSQTPIEQQLAGLHRRLEVWQVFLTDDSWHRAERKMVSMWAASVSQWLVDALLLGDQENLAAAVDTLANAHQAAIQMHAVAEPTISVLLETARAAQATVQREAWLQEQGPSSNVGGVLRTIVKEPGATTHRLRCFLSLGADTLEEILRALQDGRQIVGEQNNEQTEWTATPLGRFTVQAWLVAI